MLMIALLLSVAIEGGPASYPDIFRVFEIDFGFEGVEISKIKDSASVMEPAEIGGGRISHHDDQAGFVMLADQVQRFGTGGAFPLLPMKYGGLLPLSSHIIKHAAHAIEDARRGPISLQYVSAHGKPIRRRLPKVFASYMDTNTHIGVCDVEVRSGDFDLYPRPNLEFKGSLSDLIGFFRSVERSPDQRNTNGAQSHSYDSSRPHDESPKSGLLLRNKVLLITLISAVFIGLLCRAFIKLSDGDDAAGLPYLLLGVFGVMASLIVGPALIFGGF